MACEVLAGSEPSPDASAACYLTFRIECSFPIKVGFSARTSLLVAKLRLLEIRSLRKGCGADSKCRFLEEIPGGCLAQMLAKFDSNVQSGIYYSSEVSVHEPVKKVVSGGIGWPWSQRRFWGR